MQLRIEVVAMGIEVPASDTDDGSLSASAGTCVDDFHVSSGWVAEKAGALFCKMEGCAGVGGGWGTYGPANWGWRAYKVIAGLVEGGMED
jgi:hypothetical protein